MAGAGLAFIAALTLVPHPELVKEVARTPLWCLVCGRIGITDVLLNLLLFVPYGLGLRWAGLSRGRAQVVVSTTTLAIELLQLKLIVGRDASISDLITNSLGGAVGIWLADAWPALLLPEPRPARRLRAGGATLWLLLWLGSGAMLNPSVPPAPWFVQLAPQGQYEDDFPGKVVVAEMNGVPVRSGLLSPSSIRDSMRHGTISVKAEAVPGRPTRFLAPIVSTTADTETEILVLGQDGRDLVFRARLRVADYRLRNPAIGLEVFSSEPSGDSLHAAGGVDHGQIYLRAQVGSRTAERRLNPSPSWGWSFLLPFDYAMGPETPWLTAAWLGGLVLPLAYWAARGAAAGGTWVGLLWLVVVVTLGLAVVPPVTGLRPVPAWEWAVAALGLAAGWMLGKESVRRQWGQTKETR